MSEEIRVRFPPSPTGYMHIGNARTALFNYLFARKNGGKLILRIEDTDAERSSPEAVRVIVESLKWLKIDWDEGYRGESNEEGPDGPYSQMKRLDIYQKYIDKLTAEKKAYYCFCTEEEIELKRKVSVAKGVPYKYDGRCKSLSNDEIESLKNDKKRFVVRFEVKEKRDVIFLDLVRGRVSVNTDQIGDFVIARSDGIPVYNFAVVIDDALMRITHVIRGEDHISNTPRQILIYEGLGFSIPRFGHLPMILGADRTKMSKRHGETSLLAYRDKGFLPEAMFNYMSLLGWYPRDQKEIKTKEELVQDFDIKDVGSSGSIFDEKKLKWMNHEYIQKMNTQELYENAQPYIKELRAKYEKPDEWWKSVLSSVKTGINTFAETAELIKLFIEPDVINDEGAKVLKSEISSKVLTATVTILNEEGLTTENFKDVMKKIGEISGAKGKDLYMPVRLATTGNLHGPELALLLPAIGSKECVSRINKAMGGI